MAGEAGSNGATASPPSASAANAARADLLSIFCTSVYGTNRTNRTGLAMSVPRGRPEVAFPGRQDRLACAKQNPRRSETAGANADGWFEAREEPRCAPRTHAKIKSLRRIFHKTLLRAVPTHFIRAAHARCIYRPAPELGGGAKVDPLGEGLIRLFPDGFRPLFAPAAALPAPLLPLAPFVEVPVVPPFVDPVVVPLAAGAPAAELPLAEPLPLCASANVLESASAAATPIHINLMVSFLSLMTKGKLLR